MAQQPLRASANSTGSPNTGTGKFYYGNGNEPPRAIEFNERTVATSYFLANINNYFKIPEEFTFIEAESNTDNLGMHHRLLQQYYNGIPLEGMGYRVHERDGFVTSANGKAVRDIKLDTQIMLSEEEAFHLAVNFLQTKDNTFRNGKQLIVSKDFTFTPKSFFIAFQFDIDVSLTERWRISIDASNGQVVNKVSLVNTCFKEDESPLPYAFGTGTTNYYGTQTIRVERAGDGSRLVGQTENGGTIETYDFRNREARYLFFGLYSPYDFFSQDSTFNNPGDKPAVSVHWAAEQACDYYFKIHGRNSFDNNGAAVKSLVHVGVNYDNAFWTGKVMGFGDGRNERPPVELDVVSHELTHGVTQYEAHLQYYYEPGALNESFSDILGKAVEFYTFGDTATWQMARHWRDGGLRDFSDPNLKNQPDTYFGDMWYTDYGDNGGVHYNSGVQNFWFYLLCEGGEGINDHAMSYSINAIGMDVATKIAYRNLTEYLISTSDYLDSRIGSLLAAADLYGKNSNAYREVDKAWDAVGVIDEPIITSFELYDITATTVKIKGILVPRGDTVTYHLEYGTTTAFESSSPVYKYTDRVECILTGLQSETKYHLRLVATNENGSSYATADFTTIPPSPLVILDQTIDVSDTTATIYGRVNPNSQATSFYFEYGLTPELGFVTPAYTLPDTIEYLDVAASLADLQPWKTYYYKLIATNSFGSSATDLGNFFTAVKPVISYSSPGAGPIGTEVTIVGQYFNPTPEKNSVSFGSTRATVLSSTPTEIKVRVPAGASFGPITVLDTESGLAAESPREFVPTFTDAIEKGDLQLRVGINDVHVSEIIVEDMDRDNKPDIVGLQSRGFSVFQNVIQGPDITNESFVRSAHILPSAYSQNISLADFDGNGLKDVLLNNNQGQLRIYPNFSVPGYIFFGVPVEVSMDLPDYHVWDMASGDFDSDGRIDIAAVSYLPEDSTLLTIFRNRNPKGSLSANNFEKQFSRALPYFIHELQSNDVNNDTRPDLLFGTYGETHIPILKNNSYADVFDFEEILIPDTVRQGYVRYRCQDLNQDGWKDIASHSPVPGKLEIWQNNEGAPDITLAAPVVVLREPAASVIRPGDVNGDGKVDLLVGINNGEFIFLKNNAEAGSQLTDSSFAKLPAYGLVNTSVVGMLDMNVNDLNGDGRPEVINTYSYWEGAHDVYQMQIWQNASTCPDPSLIQVNTSNHTATIVLPPNTILDQFEIEFADSGSAYWFRINSTTVDTHPGTSYRLRARAKCYLAFTPYHYINFTTDCVDPNTFSINNIGVDHAFLSASSLSSFEVQYSPAGKDEWTDHPQYSDKISNLLPGTQYDLRFRGRCYSPAEFKYKEFTTLCPKLSRITITDLTYNKGVASWTSSYAGDAILEYSPDEVSWTPIDETGTMFPLIPGKNYFVRGKFVCTDINSDFIHKSFITPCPEVSDLHVDAITPFSARINWEDESDAGSYTLTYSMTGNGAVTTVETSSTFIDLNGLNPGTHYTVAVAPHCIGTEDFSSTTFNTVCYVPFNLSANAVTHTTAELSWSDNFSGLPYSIDYSIWGSNVWLTTGTALTEISLTGLRPGTLYEARVHINCLSETAPYASVLFETHLYEETTFAPNPTNNEITIYPSIDLIGHRFTILDNAGKQVVNAELLAYTIDLSTFSPGIYTLKIDGEKPMKILKY